MPKEENNQNIQENTELSEKELRNSGIHIWDEIAKGIAQQMPQELIPVINEIFGKDYPPDAEISFLSTEYVKPQKKEGHPFPLILSDITFQVNGKEIYHLEFQVQKDNTIAIRVLEYDVQIALQHSTEIAEGSNNLVVRFPHSAVIYPVGNTLSDTLPCTLQFQDGSTHTYQVPVVKISNYELSELFEKRLHMFLPFSLLRFQNRIAYWTQQNAQMEEADKSSDEASEEVVENLDEASEGISSKPQEINSQNSSGKSKRNLEKELTDFIEELILGLETELQQGTLSEWQHKNYLNVVLVAVNYVLHDKPKLLEEAHKLTERKFKLSSEIEQDYKDIIALKDTAIAQKDTEITLMGTKIAQLNKQNTQKDEEITSLKKKLAELQSS